MLSQLLYLSEHVFGRTFKPKRSPQVLEEAWSGHSQPHFGEGNWLIRLCKDAVSVVGGTVLIRRVTIPEGMTKRSAYSYGRYDPPRLESHAGPTSLIRLNGE